MCPSQPVPVTFFPLKYSGNVIQILMIIEERYFIDSWKAGEEKKLLNSLFTKFETKY